MEMLADTSAIREVLALAEVPEVSLQFLDCLIDFPHGLAELFSVHSELDMATGAGQLRVSFKPTKRLIDLLATLRTRNVDPGIVELIGKVGHGSEILAQPLRDIKG